MKTKIKGMIKTLKRKIADEKKHLAPAIVLDGTTFV
jgi:hypothetical protein